MPEIIVNIKSNIHLAIKDSLNTKICNICIKCKENKCHKLKQTFSTPPPLSKKYDGDYG